MLLDIFSSFDPATNVIFRLPIIFWVSTRFIFVFFSSYWLIKPSNRFISHIPQDFMHQQLTRRKTEDLKGLSFIILYLFIFFILINTLGLIPYIFSFSSHLIFTLTFGLPLWSLTILSSIQTSPKKFTAGLLPRGAPAWLRPALILIESIRISVRPLTLSFRLAANIRAGHIVLGLIRIYIVGAAINISSFVLLYSLTIIYTLFEIGICLIQAYIFCLLLTLYSDEHTS